MKTIRFARQYNTYNEYICDEVTDCTGDFLKKDDVLALIQNYRDCEVSEVAIEVLEDLIEAINE